MLRTELDLNTPSIIEIIINADCLRWTFDPFAFCQSIWIFLGWKLLFLELLLYYSIRAFSLDNAVIFVVLHYVLRNGLDILFWIEFTWLSHLANTTDFLPVFIFTYSIMIIDIGFIALPVYLLLPRVVFKSLVSWILKIFVRLLKHFSDSLLTYHANFSITSFDYCKLLIKSI